MPTKNKESASADSLFFVSEALTVSVNKIKGVLSYSLVSLYLVCNNLLGLLIEDMKLRHIKRNL